MCLVLWAGTGAWSRRRGEEKKGRRKEAWVSVRSRRLAEAIRAVAWIELSAYTLRDRNRRVWKK